MQYWLALTTLITNKDGFTSGCHNDVHNIRKYIMDAGKFKSSNITILLDDGRATSPTRANIMKALDELCKKVRQHTTCELLCGSMNYRSLFFQCIMSHDKKSWKVQAWRYWFRALLWSWRTCESEMGEDPSGYCSTLCPVDFDIPHFGQGAISIWFVQCRKVQV